MSPSYDCSRREFLTTLSAGAAGLAAISATGAAIETATAATPVDSRIRRQFAPHLGMFRHLAGDDPIDQIRFLADNGFAALEDIGFLSRSFDEQDRIVSEVSRVGMQMGPFIGTADFGNATFASGRADYYHRVFREVAHAATMAEASNAYGIIVVTGRRELRFSDVQPNENAIQLLRNCAFLCERAGTRLLLEPLNHWGRHPQMFLHSIAQGAELCEAVGSDFCRLLFDVYHQSIVESDPLGLIERHWNSIGYFQIGDNPGRKEPGTGNFDFHRFFAMTDARNYTGLFGMEHGNLMPGIEGERAVLEAYRRLGSTRSEA